MTIPKGNIIEFYNLGRVTTNANKSLVGIMKRMALAKSAFKEINKV